MDLDKCRFCLNSRKTCKILHSNQKEMLQVLFKDVNLEITENICLDCTTAIEVAFSFKSRCLEIEDNMYNYVTEGKQIELENIMGLSDEMKSETRICRTCLEIVESNDGVSLKDNDYLLNIFKQYMQELDLLITLHPVICEYCNKSVLRISSLHSMYSQTHNINEFKYFAISEKTDLDNTGNEHHLNKSFNVESKTLSEVGMKTSSIDINDSFKNSVTNNFSNVLKSSTKEDCNKIPSEDNCKINSFKNNIQSSENISEIQALPVLQEAATNVTEERNKNNLYEAIEHSKNSEPAKLKTQTECIELVSVIQEKTASSKSENYFSQDQNHLKTSKSGNEVHSKNAILAQKRKLSSSSSSSTLETICLMSSDDETGDFVNSKIRKNNTLLQGEKKLSGQEKVKCKVRVYSNVNARKETKSKIKICPIKKKLAPKEQNQLVGKVSNLKSNIKTKYKSIDLESKGAEQLKVSAVPNPVPTIISTPLNNSELNEPILKMNPQTENAVSDSLIKDHSPKGSCNSNSKHEGTLNNKELNKDKLDTGGSGLSTKEYILDPVSSKYVLKSNQNFLIDKNNPKGSCNSNSIHVGNSDTKELNKDKLDTGASTKECIVDPMYVLKSNQDLLIDENSGNQKTTSFNDIIFDPITKQYLLKAPNAVQNQELSSNIQGQDLASNDQRSTSFLQSAQLNIQHAAPSTNIQIVFNTTTSNVAEGSIDAQSMNTSVNSAFVLIPTTGSGVKKIPILPIKNKSILPKPNTSSSSQPTKPKIQNPLKNSTQSLNNSNSIFVRNVDVGKMNSEREESIKLLPPGLVFAEKDLLIDQKTSINYCLYCGCGVKHHPKKHIETCRKVDILSMGLQEKMMNKRMLLVLKCDKCSFNSRILTDVIVHVASHLKPFKADTYFCPRGCKTASFSSATDLYDHIRKIHCITGYKVFFWCITCEKYYTIRSKLMKHFDTCTNTSSRINLFRSNTMIFCMVCGRFESSDLGKAKAHLKYCIKNSVEITGSESEQQEDDDDDDVVLIEDKIEIITID